MKTMFPDYQESILALSSSILAHYGISDCNHQTLKEVDELLNKNYKNVILCLFDGMGYLNLEDHRKDSPFLYSHLLKPISSVFPPTTVAATTAVLSGKSPIETGWLGWDLYFKEIDECVDIFPNTRQFSKEQFEEHISTKYIPFESIFERIHKANRKIHTSYVSPFGDIHYEDLNHAVTILNDICKRSEKQFAYFYYMYPDTVMHKYGINSPETSMQFKQIDDFVKQLTDTSEDTLILCIADHGLIDIDWFYLDNYPELADMMLRKPSIEARAANFFIKDEFKEIFKEEFNKVFKNYFNLYTKDEVLELKLFGEGKPHPKALDFIGDYLAVSVSQYCMGVDTQIENLKGHHAGLSEKEMLVPLIVIEKEK